MLLIVRCSLTLYYMIQKKKSLKKRRGRAANFIVSLVLVIFTLSFMAMLVSSNLKLKERRREVGRKIEEIKKEISRLEGENQALRADISYKESPAYLEREARERFNLKKPGEEVAVIVPPAQAPPLVQPEPPRKSFWQNILEFFGVR